MEEEVLKVNINISDEGVVYIDGLTSDMAALDETIENNSILMYCSSENGYNIMYKNYRTFLCESGATVAEIHKKLDFVNFLYVNQSNLKKEALGSVLKVIEAASRILGVSMAETYHNIVERLNYLEQDK
jgi:repressor of nif and glnA expression